MVRHLPNPYLTTASEGAGRVTDELLQGLAGRIVDKITNRNIAAEEWSDHGPYTGMAGIAWALARASPSMAGEEMREYCQKTSEQYTNAVLQHVKPSSHKLPVYLVGDLGSLVVAMTTSSEMNKQAVERMVETAADRLIDPSYQSDEILVGRAGYLAAVLTIRQSEGDSVVSDVVISKVLAAMIESGKRYAARTHSKCPLMYAYHDKEYLGAAHGLAGILQMALSFSHLLNPADELLVRGSAEWLFSTQEPSGNFASSTDYLHSARSEPLIHWCHGAAGVIYLAIIMWKKYNEDQYLQVALTCGELIWREGVLKKGPGLCHGVAGNGYALLSLFRATSDPIWLSRARCFSLLLDDPSILSLQRVPDSPFSLFEGWAGALCFVVDLMDANIEKAQFPLFPLVY